MGVVCLAEMNFLGVSVFPLFIFILSKVVTQFVKGHHICGLKFEFNLKRTLSA